MHNNQIINHKQTTDPKKPDGWNKIKNINIFYWKIRNLLTLLVSFSPFSLFNINFVPRYAVYTVFTIYSIWMHNYFLCKDNEFSSKLIMICTKAVHLINFEMPKTIQGLINRFKYVIFCFSSLTTRVKVDLSVSF